MTSQSRLLILTKSCFVNFVGHGVSLRSGSLRTFGLYLWALADVDVVGWASFFSDFLQPLTHNKAIVITATVTIDRYFLLAFMFNLLVKKNVYFPASYWRSYVVSLRFPRFISEKCLLSTWILRTFRRPSDWLRRVGKDNVKLDVQIKPFHRVPFVNARFVIGHLD